MVKRIFSPISVRTECWRDRRRLYTAYQVSIAFCRRH